MDNVIQNINIEDIVPNNYQHQYDVKELEELASSIKIHGLLEPITLRPKGTKYELILGNKRYKACIIAGLKTIPSIIKKIDDIQVKEYLKINNDTLILNDMSLSNSIQNNLDVINLSKLNEEYERDDLKMNTNQFENNNVTQPQNNNEPAFGGRFFPSLEDEPTNMNFQLNDVSMPKSDISAQPANNFIDLTDLNVGVQQPPFQNNVVEPNVSTTPNFNIPNMNPSFDAQPLNQNQISDNNIINLESLKQNPEMGTQPVAPEMKIDNNFQEVINDFQPNNNIMPNQFAQPVMNEPIQMNSPVQQPLPNVEPMMNQPYSLEPEMNSPINEIPALNNQELIQPNFNSPITEPTMSMMTNEQPMMTPEIAPNPLNQTVVQKDILPVINTLKALAINLETFGYTIRITDEDLTTSYKITIEVDK